jgi:hypothetical protein
MYKFLLAATIVGIFTTLANAIENQKNGLLTR